MLTKEYTQRLDVLRASYYNTNYRSIIIPIIWPDNDSQSEASLFLKHIRAENGPNFWSDYCKVFKYCLETLPIETFKMWAVVWMVPLFNTDRLAGNIISTLVQCLQKDSVYFNYCKSLSDPDIGYNRSTDFDNYFRIFDGDRVTAQRVQHVNHLINGNITPEDLASTNTILEIGAGLGDMADVVCKAGFKGKYIVYDFPELLAIHKWYHTQMGITNVEYVSNPDELESVDLCIATYSLTEMPLTLRDEIVSKIKDTKKWLIAYSYENFKIDNKKYIHDVLFPTIKNTHTLKTVPINNQTFDGGGSEYIILERN